MHNLSALQFIITTTLLGIHNGIEIFDGASVLANNDIELFETSCTTATHCQQFEQTGVKASCIDGRCICYTEATRAVSQCIPKEKIVNNIVSGQCPCSIMFAECNLAEQICYCAPGYVPSKDRRRCLNKCIQLGQKCELDEQCYGTDPLATCKGVCVCKNKYSAINNTCVAELTDENMPCNTYADCVDHFNEHALCILEKKICACRENFVTSNRTSCLPAANINETCSINEQCQLKLGKGAHCRDSLCSCDEHHALHQVSDATETWKCEPLPELGQYCYNKSDCYQYQRSAEDQSMTCLRAECRCKQHYHTHNHRDCNSGSIAKYLISNASFVFFVCILCYLFS